jgi:hypothetical protein
MSRRGFFCSDYIRHYSPDALDFARKNAEVWHVIVPFDQCRGMTAPRDRLPVKLPHSASDGPAVIIDQEPGAIAILVLGKAGEMELADMLKRKRADVGSGIETVIDRADVDIVHVEQQSAACTLCDGR